MSVNQRIRCVLVHDHVLLRQGLRRLLEDEPDMEVVAEAGNALAALQRVFEQRPDVIIADASVFAFGAEQIEQLVRQGSPQSQLLFLTTHELDDPKPGEARAEGNCAARRTSAQELAQMVRKIHSAKTSGREFPGTGRAQWQEDATPTQQRVLTEREREVLKLLAEGRTVRSAAGVLGLSAKTVDAHKFNLMRKLGIHNKAELVMWAIQQRVVKMPANF
jgi:two-component system response regulator NreC